MDPAEGSQHLPADSPQESPAPTFRFRRPTTGFYRRPSPGFSNVGPPAPIAAQLEDYKARYAALLDFTMSVQRDSSGAVISWRPCPEPGPWIPPDCVLPLMPVELIFPYLRGPKADERVVRSLFLETTTNALLEKCNYDPVKVDAFTRELAADETKLEAYIDELMTMNTWAGGPPLGR